MAQVDTILVRNNWHNSAMNAESYKTFSSVFTDHRVVSIKIPLSLRAPKLRGNKVKYDWKAFSTTPDLQMNCEIEVRNRFQLLQKDEDPTDCYERFVQTNEETKHKE